MIVNLKRNRNDEKIIRKTLRLDQFPVIRKQWKFQYMKYTKEQAKRLKNKNMNGYTRSNPKIIDVKIKDGFYIIESKMNYKTTNN